MSIEGLYDRKSSSAAGPDRGSDDGHIVVCVRVRNVPSNLDIPQYDIQRDMRPSNHSRRICVSVVENIVVMHDPKSIDDAYGVERDSTHVMHLLTDSDKSPLRGGGVSYSSKKTNYSIHSRSPLMSRSVNSQCSSTFTGTTNCYVCDQCVVSMDASSIPMMPLLRSNNLFRTPAFGTQAAVYHATAVHAVKAVLGGINSCVFTYGQTGSGKTYTLFGDPTSAHRDPGLATRTLEDIFLTLDDISSTHAKEPVTQDFKYTVLLSFMEIYRNEVFCLLSGKGPLRVRLAGDADGAGEGAVIDGLLQTEVCTAEAAHRLLKVGLRRRRVGKTDMNASSSRSHAILQIRVAQWRTNHHTRETIEHSAKISLVDLAGSERQRTASTQQGKPADGIHINQSLTALSRVINDVACGAKFVNYRDSLLTMILKDSLGGNSKTFMIATISPIAYNFEESCATLAYSNAVRRIYNHFTANCTIHKYLSPLISNSHPGEEGPKGLAEKMDNRVRHLKGTSNSLHGYIRTLSGFTTQKQIPLTTKTSPLMLTCRKEQKVCEAITNSTPLAPLRVPLIFVSHHKRLKTAGAADPDISDISDLVRIATLDDDLLELNLAQLIQSNSLLGFSKPQNNVAVSEPVVANVEEQQFMIQKEVDRAMEARITPLLERPLFENHGSESSRSCTSAKEKDEVRTAVGNISRLSTGISTSQNPLPTSFGCLNFKRDSQDDRRRSFHVYFTPLKEMECVSGVVDVQVNGNRLGENRHRLKHGDIVCIIFQDGTFCENTQDRLFFHYIDLNHYNENIVPVSDPWAECLDDDTEPLTVSYRCVVKETGQQQQHNVTGAIKPATDDADSTAFEHLPEDEPLLKADSVPRAQPNSPSPQLPSDSSDRKYSPLLMDSSQGLMCCVSSPSLRSPTRIVCEMEHNIGSAPAPPMNPLCNQLDFALEENRSPSSLVAHPNTLRNPIVERGLDALQGIWIPEQRRSGISGGDARSSGDQRATDLMISDDLKNMSFPEVSQFEPSISHVSLSSDELEGLMVVSKRPTVYQKAIFAESAVTYENDMLPSAIPIVAPSVDLLQGQELTIPPRLPEAAPEQYSKVVWESSPRNRVSVLQVTIQNLEAEKRKLQEENRQSKESLKKFKNYIESSQGAKMDAVVDPGQSPVVVQCLGQLASEQGRTIEELRSRVTHLEQLASSKEGEIRVVLRYVEDGGLMSIDGSSHFVELHHRIEELISEGISKQGNTPASGGSVFPNDFNSSELTALISVSLRILFNRLKNEIFAINKQSLERMSLILDAVSQHREAQLSRFTLELRGIVADVVGRPQRSGARWSLTAEDVSTRFVKDYRDRVIDTFYSMLIWYDTWDISSNIEHVCGMELIRNTDRIIQIARQVRQGSLPRCDMTVTTTGLDEIGKQNVVAADLCPIQGGEEVTKPSHRAKRVASNVGESVQSMHLSKNLRGSVLDQLGKVQIGHNKGSDVAKVMISSRRLSRSDNSTSLQSSSHQVSRSKGLVPTAGGLALKNRERLVIEKKVRVPSKGTINCSNENTTQGLPVRNNKSYLGVNEGSSKGVRASKGDLFTRTRSLTSLSSTASFTRYNTAIPSLGCASRILESKLRR